MRGQLYWSFVSFFSLVDPLASRVHDVAPLRQWDICQWQRCTLVIKLSNWWILPGCEHITWRIWHHLLHHHSAGQPSGLQTWNFSLTAIRRYIHFLVFREKDDWSFWPHILYFNKSVRRVFIYLALLHSVSPIKDVHGVQVCSSPFCIGLGSTN